MANRKLIVIAGDDIGREVIPLAVQSLHAVLPAVQLTYAEAGAEHASRTGQALDEATLSLIQAAGSVLMGPERPRPDGTQTALARLTAALDLYAVLYPICDREGSGNLLLLVAHGSEPNGGRIFKKALSPLETWSATRLGNLAALLASRRRGKLIIAHESEEPFVQAVASGVAEQTSMERLDAVFLVNQVTQSMQAGDLVVTSAATGAMLLPLIIRQAAWPHTTGRLLLGPHTSVAIPAHGPLREQVGWGFVNPLASMYAVVALLRYGWGDEAAAYRLEAAIDRATARRRTPDMGGLHTMYEVTRAVVEEARRFPS